MQKICQRLWEYKSYYEIKTDSSIVFSGIECISCIRIKLDLELMKNHFILSVTAQSKSNHPFHVGS